MLNKLRNFSKGKLAGVLVGIIIIPFVFWGMGSVFSGGNTNSIVKINNHNVSTQDFADFINNSKISPESIKENINNNVLEELLKQLISTSLIDIEIDKLKRNHFYLLFLNLFYFSFYKFHLITHRYHFLDSIR